MFPLRNVADDLVIFEFSPLGLGHHRVASKKGCCRICSTEVALCSWTELEVRHSYPKWNTVNPWFGWFQFQLLGVQTLRAQESFEYSLGQAQRCALRTLFWMMWQGDTIHGDPHFSGAGKWRGVVFFFFCCCCCCCWCHFIVFLFMRCRCFGEINGICYPAILLVWIIVVLQWDMFLKWFFVLGTASLFTSMTASSKGTVLFPDLLAQMDSQWGRVEGLVHAKFVDNRCICIYTVHCMCLKFYGIEFIMNN